MLYKSRRRPCGQPHRRRQQSFFSVDKPKTEAEREAALNKVLVQIEAKFPGKVIKGGKNDVD